MALIKRLRALPVAGLGLSCSLFVGCDSEAPTAPVGPEAAPSAASSPASPPAKAPASPPGKYRTVGDKGGLD